jgi:hypothetical protein
MEPLRLRLPVSGETVLLQPPTGAEDLHLLEVWDNDIELALALAKRLSRRAEDDSHTSEAASHRSLDWREMPVADLDALILRLRQAVIGDRIRADVICGQSDCGRRIEISFRISEYLGQHKPAKPVLRGSWQLEVAEETGWFRLSAQSEGTGKLAASTMEGATRSSGEGATQETATEIRFRLPAVADQLAAAGFRNGDAARELARRCLRPADAPARLRRLAEAAMEALAPALSSELRGNCPECGRDVVVYFEPRRFCLRELRERALFIYEDIDVLARRYHWSERDILALPRARRANYAEFARREEARF